MCSVSHVRPDWREEARRATCDRGQFNPAASGGKGGGRLGADLGFSGWRGNYVHKFLLTLDSWIAFRFVYRQNKEL